MAILASGSHLPIYPLQLGTDIASHDLAILRTWTSQNSGCSRGNMELIHSHDLVPWAKEAKVDMFVALQSSRKKWLCGSYAVETSVPCRIAQDRPTLEALVPDAQHQQAFAGILAGRLHLTGYRTVLQICPWARAWSCGRRTIHFLSMKVLVETDGGSTSFPKANYRTPRLATSRHLPPQRLSGQLRLPTPATSGVPTPLSRT